MKEKLKHKTFEEIKQAYNSLDIKYIVMKSILFDIMREVYPKEFYKCENWLV